jgi:hypothetical protein
MTIAPNHPTLAAVPSVDDSAVADVTTLCRRARQSSPASPLS